MVTIMSLGLRHRGAQGIYAKKIKFWGQIWEKTLNTKMRNLNIYQIVCFDKNEKYFKCLQL